jgi:glucosamine--fructose-6-phosphate aminotransferase (isomerizing)
MCGIVAYVGARPAGSVVLDGLRRLEYRGYDSAGIAVLDGSSVELRRRAGALANLEAVLDDAPLPESGTGLGHTRWATHGGPTDANAHPHLDCKGALAVIHNGVIENHAELRAQLLESGHEFRSQTDTEVAAHLLEEAFVHSGDLAAALREVCRAMEGSFSLVAIHRDEPGVVVGARRN